MAPEDFAADAKQHETDENIGKFAKQRADKATDHHPQRRHDKGGAADRQRGGHNADLQEGQTDADGHRVKAGGEGGGDQKPETMVRTASENLGLCRVAPLPMEAAKASMDMPKARRMVADKFMCVS